MRTFFAGFVITSIFCIGQAFADFKECARQIHAAIPKTDQKFEVSTSGKISMLPQFRSDERRLTSDGSELIFKNSDGTYSKLVSHSSDGKLSQLTFFGQVTKEGANEKAQQDDYFDWTGDECSIGRISQTFKVDDKPKTLIVIDKNLCLFVRGISKAYKPEDLKPNSEYYRKVDALVKKFDDSLKSQKANFGLIGGPDSYSGTSADSTLITTLPGICNMYYSHFVEADIPRASGAPVKAKASDRH